MERHVKILAILSSLWGALALVLGLSLLLLAGGAIALLNTPQGNAVGLAAGLTAGIYALAGVSALSLGAASVWSGALLSRHRPLGRMVGLGLAVINLLVLPFGTALGLYALWVLLTDEAHRLFEAHAIS